MRERSPGGAVLADSHTKTFAKYEKEEEEGETFGLSLRIVDTPNRDESSYRGPAGFCSSAAAL